MASVHPRLFACLVVAIMAVSLSRNVAAGRILQESGITASALHDLTTADDPQRRTIPQQYAVTEVYKAYLQALAKKQASKGQLDESKDETNVGDAEQLAEDEMAQQEDEMAQQEDEVHADP